MKNICIVVLACMLALPSIAQEKEKLSRKEKQEIKKQQRMERDSLALLALSAAVESQRFVLEADQLQGKKGVSIQVMSDINFVLVDSSKAVFQLGSLHLIGINGVGGVTVEGRVSKYTCDKLKKGNGYYIQMTVRSNVGVFDFNINAMPNTRSSATVTSSRRGRFTYLGRIVALPQTRIYKGMSF